MTRHLTMEELLAVRAGDVDQSVQAHLDGCADCGREYHRVAQRVAALKALSVRRPPRDRWPVVRARLKADGRRTRMRRITIGVTAVAASLALAVLVVPRTPKDNRPFAQEVTASVQDLQTRSQLLEARLAAYGTEGRVVDGRTAAVIADLEDRIALVDAGIVQARRTNAPVEDVTDLWRGRVELMDALVNAHVARASYVGF